MGVREPIFGEAIAWRRFFTSLSEEGIRTERPLVNIFAAEVFLGFDDEEGCEEEDVRPAEVRVDEDVRPAEDGFEEDEGVFLWPNILAYLSFMSLDKWDGVLQGGD